MNGNSAARLKSFIDRVERLKDEIKALNTDVSEVYKEAKDEGWDTTAMKALVKERAAKEKSPEGYAELQSILDLYRDAIETGTLHAPARVHAHEDQTNSAPLAHGAAAPSGSRPDTEGAGAGVSSPQHPPINSNPPSEDSGSGWPVDEAGEPEYPSYLKEKLEKLEAKRGCHG